MKYSTARRCLAVAAIAATSLVVPQGASAQTATPSRAAASNADAIGIDADLRLVSGAIPVDQRISRATQAFPPGQTAPASQVLLNPVIAPITTKARTVGAMAGATGEPQGVASAEVEGLEALVSGQTKVLEADVVRAQSNSDCINDPNGMGTIIVGLKVLGTSIAGPINGAFPPNFQPPTPVKEALAALGLTLIINEQHPAADGRGFVVNGLHLFDAEPATLPVGALFNGDLIISHAATSVNCPNGRGSTGATSVITIDKTASKPTARPGEEVTYVARIQNKSTQTCRVNQFIDHLPEPFEFVSTSGDFGTVALLENRAAGGTDVVIKPTDKSVAPNMFATQTFVVKVKADAKPGVYFNNTELLCANLGNFIGIDAPVEVPGAAQRQPQCSDGVDNDGDGKIDFPSDPGCDSRQDDDERNFQCSDRVDNDGDGKIDFPNDPGCSSPQDDSELNSLARTGASGVTFLLGGLLLAAAVLVRRFRFTH